MEDELLQMKNLGKTSAQWLHAAGIHNAADLRRLGPILAYRAVKARDFRTSKALLYYIAGALNDLDWRDLTQADKARLDGELSRLCPNPKNADCQT
ncbi:TfoX/Sxy family protein [Pseudomonas sp. NPDC088368]|jgi:TfoX/Sxy family transcriptional regulator of competence genes|uniref:TfoX/Sxy family protein n=1 Tax=Pseudomonas sp. NPDC088368 TaxID=3364453 RepID=UPI0037FA78DD